MLSRGALGLASPRVRRGLALSWSALFVLSLLLQYMAFATAPAALAAHDNGLFELDGNAIDEAKAGADWQNGAEGAADFFFAGAASEAEANDSTYFTTGGSKDELDIPSWAITSNSVPDKDELLDAYGAIYQSGGNTWFYFGADRFDNDGNAQIGFWFFQNKVGIANGDFTGTHKDGDILILSEYTNGGVVDLVCAYEWAGGGGGKNIADKGDCDPATSGSHLNLVAAGAECDVADGTFDICAVTNPDTATAPWPFKNKDKETDFATGQFFEGGINLTEMFGGDPPCFGTFLAETRSSQETDAQLKDFALGSLSTCVPPTIATQVRQDGSSLGSVGTINMGESVTDHATFSGAHGAVEGTAKFFVCGPSASTPNCATGGTAAGTDTISGGAADSDTVTPTQVGFYCFRVEYIPTADSQYLAGGHTNQTTECFQVLPANVTIDKTADDGSVDAGDQIGFTLSWGNSGAGKATGVVITDNLPAGGDLDWSIAGSTGTGSTCAISGAVGSEVLTCNVGSINGNTATSGSVHVVSATTKADCGTVDNTGSIVSGNDGSGNASDSVEVLCAAIDIEKVANPAGPVSAGDTIGFDITVTNKGGGTAHGVVATDDLPGSGWVADAPTGDTTGVSCGIAAGTLTCTDDVMAAGDSFTVHVHRATTAADCGTVNNTADVSSTNDGEDSDSASVEVDCPDIKVTKTPDEPDNDIPAGQDLEFTIVVQNVGDGVARNVHLTDVLPAGFDWTEDSADCSITAGTLSCDFGDMPAGASATVHLTAPTSAVGENANIDCSEGGSVDIPNVASATSSNEGQDVLGNNSDPGDIDVLCSALVIEKDVTDVNDQAPVNDPDLGVPGTEIDDIVTFTLHYTGSGLLENAFIVDVLPVGEDYVAGTASSNADFGFTGATFNSSTGQWTLRWDATGDLPDPADGTVSYDVKVLAAAAEQPQPLTNTATIQSDQTGPDSDTAAIAVAPPPEELTPPPTDVFTPSTGTSNPGFTLMLILLGVAAATIAIGFITPVPARARRRDR
jgi:uncharacterized repeat protein (TIGR01451 family)